MLKIVRDSTKPRIHKLELAMRFLGLLQEKKQEENGSLGGMIEISLIDFSNKLFITYRDADGVIEEKLVAHDHFTRSWIKQFINDLIWDEDKRTGRRIDW